VYGAGFFSLDKEQILFQVPDFSNRSWVYALYDARPDEFSEIGKQYDTKAGFYLMVGPNWGNAPAIASVVRSSTNVVPAAPRAFIDDTPEHHAAVQSVLRQINFYPLSEFEAKIKSTDWSTLPNFSAPPSGGKGEPSG